MLYCHDHVSIVYTIYHPTKKNLGCTYLSCTLYYQFPGGVLMWMYIYMRHVIIILLCSYVTVESWNIPGLSTIILGDPRIGHHTNNKNYLP